MSILKKRKSSSKSAVNSKKMNKAYYSGNIGMFNEGKNSKRTPITRPRPSIQSKHTSRAISAHSNPLVTFEKKGNYQGKSYDFRATDKSYDLKSNDFKSYDNRATDKSNDFKSYDFRNTDKSIDLVVTDKSLDKLDKSFELK